MVQLGRGVILRTWFDPDVTLMLGLECKTHEGILHVPENKDGLLCSGIFGHVHLIMFGSS